MTIATGQAIDAADHAVIRCKVHTSGSATGSGSYQPQSFSVEAIDTDNMFSLASPTRITIQTAGTYLVGASITFNANNVGGIILQLNGSTTIASGGCGNAGGATPNGAHCTVLRTFAQNDYIEVYASTNGSSSSTGDEATNFWAIKQRGS